jgi:transposase-like protein
VTLSNEVECDEAYVIAGHKGQPEMVQNKGRKGRRRQLKGPCGRGTLEKERPPVLGMMQRGGQVVLNLLANVQQKTIEPFIKATIIPGTLVYTDEYSIYGRLQIGCLNRFLSIDRFLDSRCQSRLCSAWWHRIFKQSASNQVPHVRPQTFFVTI